MQLWGARDKVTMAKLKRCNRWSLAATASMLVIVLNVVGCSRLPGLPGAGSDATGSADAPNTTIAGVATPDAGQSTSSTDARPATSATLRPGVIPPVAVRRGSIAQTLPLVGKVAAPEEVPLSFDERALVTSVPAKVGQTVEAGQVLVATDAAEMQAKVDMAQARLDDDTTGLTQAQAAAAAKQRAAAQESAAAQQARADRIAAAQTNLNTARATLQKVQVGAAPVDIQAAENALTAAQIAEHKAEAAQAKATAGADPALVRAAEQELSNAQAAVVRAQADLDKGPADVASARQRLQMAQDIADAARGKLQAVQQPDQNALDAAQLGVNSAQLAVQAAQARVDQLRAGPAQADLRPAQDAVNQAQAALDRAQSSTAADQGTDVNGDGTSADLDARQKAIDKDNTDLGKLEERLAAKQLLAPFAGTVVSVRVRVGDTVDPGRPALTIAKPASPIVRATVTPGDRDKVSVGQSVLVQVQGQPDTAPPLSGKVVSLTPNDAGTARIADVGLDWPDAAPKLGTVVDLGMVLQQKDDALLVPKKAVHTVNSRTFVELVDGSTKRVLNVQLGIVSSTDAEIVGGLSLGQLVVVGP
jgi:multidrug efflux pump subunit AcrA (membrane-fusion protein)